MHCGHQSRFPVNKPRPTWGNASLMSKAGGIETLTQVRLDPPGFTLLIVPYTPCFKSLYYGLRIFVEYPLSFQLSQ